MDPPPSGKGRLPYLGNGSGGPAGGGGQGDGPFPGLPPPLLPRHGADSFLGDDPRGVDARPLCKAGGSLLGCPPDAGTLRPSRTEHRLGLESGRDSDPPGGRDRPRHEDPRRGFCHTRLLRGGRLQQGGLPRGSELRGRPQASGDLPLREQPVRNLRSNAAPDGHRTRIRSGRGLWIPGGYRRRRRRPRCVRRDGQCGHARAARRRADSGRGHDVPNHSSLL